MKIEIWSDYVCPFCYIGERKLSKALELTKMKDKVEIVFHSFELNPHAKKEYDENINKLMADKYGMSLERAIEANKGIVESAQSVGLVFNFEDLQPTNTFDAHRVSHLARSEGKLIEFTEAVMRSYFTDSLNISDTSVLLKVAKEVGLSSSRVKEILDSKEFTDEVRQDEQKASQSNISGVPYFLFNGEEAISGAQAVEIFVDVIEKRS